GGRGRDPPPPHQQARGRPPGPPPCPPPPLGGRRPAGRPPAHDHRRLLRPPHRRRRLRRPVPRPPARPPRGPRPPERVLTHPRRLPRPPPGVFGPLGVACRGGRVFGAHVVPRPGGRTVLAPCTRLARWTDPPALFRLLMSWRIQLAALQGGRCAGGVGDARGRRSRLPGSGRAWGSAAVDCAGGGIVAGSGHSGLSVVAGKS